MAGTGIATQYDLTDSAGAYQADIGAESLTTDRDVYFSGGTNAGDLCMIDTADTTYGLGKSVKACDSADTALVVGFSVETTSAGSFGKIRTYGPMQNANVDSGIAAGVALASKASPSGRTTTATFDDDLIIAVTLETSASNAGDIFITIGG